MISQSWSIKTKYHQFYKNLRKKELNDLFQNNRNKIKEFSNNQFHKTQNKVFEIIEHLQRITFQKIQTQWYWSSNLEFFAFIRLFALVRSLFYKLFRSIVSTMYRRTL